MLNQQLIKSLKVAQLKELLVAIGSKTAGTKDQLSKRLESDLHRPKVAKLAQDGNPQPSRLLSIDMGIKNLGLCVADMSFGKPNTGAKPGIAARLHISRWERLTLVDADEPNTYHAEEAGDGGGGHFSPPALSAVAVRLVRERLLPLRPSSVLIEQQRWRSGGRAAVAEWTLRVNALEAMLWAAFRAARPTAPPAVDADDEGGDGWEPELHAVSPARVAAFWLPGLRRVEKKAKVDLVRTCAARGGLGGVEVAFGEGAVAVARGFGTSGGRAKGRAADDVASGRRKLDDLADSLLQASAWAAWEANRRSLLDEGIEIFLARCREPSHVHDDLEA
jgi:cruciform cutting endonuclease 1